MINFFIRPLPPELQARTLEAHNIRGICLYFTTGRPLLYLPYILGLSSHVSWYVPNFDQACLTNAHANVFYRLAAEYWKQGYTLDSNSLALRMATMDSDGQARSLLAIENFLTTNQHLQNMKQSDKLPPDVMHRLADSLASLEAALLAKDAMMPQHLRNTHAILISYPETVHLLDDAEIARIIDAAEVHTKTEIVKAIASGKPSGGGRKKIGVEDL